MIKINNGKCEMHGDGAKLISEFFTVCRALTAIATQGAEINNLDDDRAEWLKRRLEADLAGCVSVAFSGINDSDEEMSKRFEEMVKANVDRFSCDEEDTEEEQDIKEGEENAYYC